MERRVFVSLLALVVVVVFLGVGMILLHQFGEPGPMPMDDYMIVKTQSETGANNGVTAVVFDYRGFDTLGEATILFAAVAGVVALFRRHKK